MKILFIGGSGIISSACTALAAERGLDLTLLNRGQSARPIPPGLRVLTADLYNHEQVKTALAAEDFDVVVNWIAFTPDRIEADLDLFRGRTRQYVFISSASAYHKPIRSLPITESTPLHNPWWEYARNKIACEDRLMRAYREEGFPITIVRPSHTYDQTLLPFHGGWIVVDRMRRGKPVIVHGDGTSTWVLTHHADFALGFMGLMGHPKAIGEAFHITSDEALTWDEIARAVGRAAGAEPEIVHVPSEVVASVNQRWGDSLLGDKSHSVIFDNSKIRRLVPEFRAVIPFARGIEEVIAWYDSDPARRQIDPAFEAIYERILAAQMRALEATGG